MTVENTTEWSPGGASSVEREEAMARSLVAVHTMLAVDGARFVSLLDPLDEAADAAAECHSDGSYPVLVGDETVILSSPIILYDHPEVAPQSPGDLYDALEIDEILALRVMTLTDEEKAEARGTDPRSAAIIERCDGLSPESMSRLHGQMRPVAPDPDWVTLTTPSEGGVGVTSPDADPSPSERRRGGTLPPTRRWTPGPTPCRWTGSNSGRARRSASTRRDAADAQDMFLDGRRATVAGVFADVDGGWHLAVTLDDDPAAGELEWQGRYLYFHTHEVEPLGQGEQAERDEQAEQGTLFGGSEPGRAGG